MPRLVEQPATRVASRIERLATRVASRIERLATRVASRIEQPATRVGSHIERPATRVASRIERLATRVASRIEQPATRVGSHIERPATRVASLSHRADRYQGSISHRADRYQGNISYRAARYQGSISYRAARYQGSISYRAARYQGSFSYRAARSLPGQRHLVLTRGFGSESPAIVREVEAGDESLQLGHLPQQGDVPGGQRPILQAAVHGLLVLEVVHPHRALEGVLAREDGRVVQVLAGQGVFEGVGATQLVDVAEAQVGVVVNQRIDQPQHHVNQHVNNLCEIKFLCYYPYSFMKEVSNLMFYAQLTRAIHERKRFKMSYIQEVKSP